MKIEEVMTRQVDTVTQGTPIADAAREMKRIDSGFLPVTDAGRERLIGVATDRDIVLRCVADRCDPSDTPVDEAMSDKVLYCFAGDDVESAARSMAGQQVYRLVVLDDPEAKNLVGIVSLNDIRRHGAGEAAEEASEHIVEAA